MRAIAMLMALTAASALAATLAATPEPALQVIDGAIPTSLIGRPGDATRGRAIVVDRTAGLCLLCHAGPFPDERFQGNLSPDLTGVGARYTEGELRLRMVDARRLNPDTIMPSYYRSNGLRRVAPAWEGRTILSAAQIEDVVAFLVTLRN